MRRRDPGRGFERVGSGDLHAAGVPAREARRLRLDRAWSRVAGEAIGRRAHAADIRRGVLEIEIADPAWARELAPLLPRIVARIAHEFPDLGVRKFRTAAAGTTIGRAAAFEPLEAAPAAALPAARTPAPMPGPRATAELSPGDFLDLATRYLARAREPRPR